MNEDEHTGGLILVGFGKHELKDMMEWVDTDQEEDLIKAFTKWPAVWREERICSEAEMKAALQYLAFCQDAILEYELDKENKDGN
jgi:hypothetical protein